MSDVTRIPTREGIKLGERVPTRVPTTMALVSFSLMRGAMLHQVEALRIAYTTQDEAQRLAGEILRNLLEANPNTFGTYTLTWPNGI